MTQIKLDATKISYEDLCFLVVLMRKIEEEEAITLFCIIEQLLRAK